MTIGSRLAAALLLLQSPTLAGPIAAGTAGRAWLVAGQTPVSGMPASPAGHAMPVADGSNGLLLDPTTRVWGLPVPRRGDFDYAADNRFHTGVVPAGPLVLPARVFSPDGRIDRTRPCLLIANGYGVDDRAPENRGSDGPIFDTLVPRGYTGVLVALRQASSDPPQRQIGTNGYYRHYGEDGVAIINEMVRRLGCAMTNDDPRTARVGMLGASLVGGAQWAVVARADYPAALRAIAPDVAGINLLSYATLWFPGGMLPGPLRLTRPGREFGEIFPAHRDFDSYWRDRQLTTGQVQAAASRRLALLMTGGWDDYNTPGNLETYVQFRALSGPTLKQLVIAPTGHTTPAWLYRPLVAEWMDWHVRGVSPPTAPPPVQIYIQGADRWRAEATWPIADAKSVALALTPCHSGTIDSRNDGTLMPGHRRKCAAAGKKLAVFDFDPDHGPFLHVMISQSVTKGNDRRLTNDQTADEARLTTWTSPPITTATELTGNAVLDFWAASTIDDADIVASLAMVAPDGTSRQIVQGYLNGPRAAFARPDADIGPPLPLQPDVPRHFSLRLLPTAIVIPAGYRLRLALAGGTDTGIGNDGAPQRQPQGPGKNPRTFSVRIMQSDKHPATLLLPIIGDVPAAFVTK